MANDAFTQQALANDQSFRRRVKSALAKIAFEVLTENPATVGHNVRATYARNILLNLDASSVSVAGWLVMRTNLFAFNTTVSLDNGVPIVTTASGDADIESQLASDWSLIAGV